MVLVADWSKEGEGEAEGDSPHAPQRIRREASKKKGLRVLGVGT